jgi:hypothetical protein
MPATSAYGSGRRSVYRPTSGWRSDAVIIKASVIRPICAKLRAKDRFSSG